MSYEPPVPGKRPQDRLELKWKKSKGYAPDSSSVKDTIIVWGAVLAVVGLSMVLPFWLKGDGESSNGAVLFSIFFVYGGAALAVISFEGWKGLLPSPVITIPATIQQGESVTVDLRFPANSAASIKLVEVVATEERHIRGRDGALRSNNHRLAAEPFVAGSLSEPADSTEQIQTFVGKVPDEVRTFRPMWFVAVHVRRNRFFSYVRAYPVDVQPPG